MATLKRDPTRTTLLRRKFIAQMNKRFKRLNSQVYELIVKEDSFGLKSPYLSGISPLAFNEEYQFLTNPQKVTAFRSWLQQRVDAGISEVDGMGKAWTNEYVGSSYKKGMVRAYSEIHPEALGGTKDFYVGGRHQYLQSAFAAPETMQKLELLYMRAFDGLKDVTTQMSQQMSRILTDGLANGDAPGTIARQLSKRINKLNITRARVIARTEVIHAHAEGSLDGLEKLGVSKVKAQVEWSTAGDDLVCPHCAEMEGKTFTIKEARGLIPLHPNCRCAWIPV